MFSNVLKLFAERAVRDLTLALVIGLALSAGHRPAAAQNFNEYPTVTPFGDPYGITAGPDGALWFTENGGKIGRITTAGVMTEFPIPTANSNPLGITSGPDGALWFVEYSANQIGRITTAGVVTEFPIPTANSNAFYIAAGAARCGSPNQDPTRLAASRPLVW
jgi:virginiamycin B lyase